MNIKHLIICGVILWLGCAIIVFPAEAKQNKTTPMAVKGILDLTDWDFEQDGAIKLDGEWEFYWNQLLSPDTLARDFANNKAVKTGFFNVPSDWNGYLINGQPLSGEGYATFRLIIKIKQPQLLTLKVQELDTSYRLWLDQKLLSSRGTVGKTATETIPQYSPQISHFITNGQTMELVLQIANFAYKDGGFYRSLTLGTATQIEQQTQQNWLFQMALFGSLSFMALYHFGLYMLRRKDLSSLYFGLFCSLLALRAIEPGERILSFFLGLDFEIATKMGHVTVFPSAVIFFMFLETIFPQETSKKIGQVLLALAMAYSLIVLIMPAKIFSQLLVPSEIVTIGLCFYGLGILIKANINKRDGAIFFMIGLVVLFFTVANDILYDNGLIQTAFLAPLGTFIFTFLQAFFLLVKFSRTFTEVEILSEELQFSNQKLAEYNLTLSEKVKERTFELQEKIEKIEQVEKIIRESEEKYRHLVERANDGIVIIQDTIVKYANPRLIEMVGYSVETIIGSTFTDYFHPNEVPQVLDRYRRRLDGEMVEPIYETVIRRNDGNDIHIEVNAGLISYQGELSTLIFIRDITERHRVKEELQRHNRELDLFGRASQMFSSSLDLDEVFEAVLGGMRYFLDVVATSLWLIVPETNELVCQHANGPKNEMVIGWRLPVGQGLVGWVAQHGKSLIVPDVELDERHFKAVDRLTGFALRSVLSIPLRVGGKIIGVLNLVDTKVNRFTHHDLRLLEPIATAAATAIENARLYTTMQQELAERKRAEESLRLSEEMYSTLIENIQDGVFLIQDGKLRFVNESFARMVGYTAEEIRNMDFDNFVAPEDSEMVDDHYMQRLTNLDAPSEYEFHLFHRDDTTRVLVNMTIGLVMYHGESASIGTVKDITERRQVEDLLRVQRDLGLSLSSTDDQMDALRAVLDVVCRVEGVDCGSMYLVNEHMGQLSMVVHQGLSEQFVENNAYFEPDSCYVGEVMQAKPIYGHYAKTDLVNTLSQQEGLRAFAIIPIMYEGQLIATLNLASHIYDEIAPRTKEVIETASVQIGGAIARIKAEQSLTERESYLTTLVSVQQRLMAVDSDPYTEILALLGKVSQASRVYIFENHQDARMELLMSQQVEWVAEGIEAQINNPELQNLPYHQGFQRWQDVLEQGGIIAGKISDFPEEERQILEAQAILSILVLPLTIHGEFYGFIGFDDCVEGRAWNPSEVSLIWAAAAAISLAKENQQTENALKESYQRFSTVVSSISDHIYMTEFTKDGSFTNGFVSPNVEELTGYPMKKFIDDWSFWPTLIHLHDRTAAATQAACFARGQNSEVEYRMIRADGKIIWVRDSGRVEQNLARQSLMVYGVVSDITQRKHMETELRVAYQNLKQLTERLQNELHLAQRIQQSLLPPANPNWSELKLICYNISAREVGGDLYAYHAFNHNGEGRPPKYAIAVGDVSGKGMPAALLMAVSVALFRSFVNRDFPPNKLLEQLDLAIVPYTTTTQQNCALIYLEIIPPPPGGKGLLRVSNAGCIIPIIKRVDGTVEWIEVGGMPLGVGWGAETGYEEVTSDLAKGDLIILTSDGVVESKNNFNKMFGFERLEQSVRMGPITNAEAMLDHLKSEVAAFVGETEPHDDITIVVVQV